MVLMTLINKRPDEAIQAAVREAVADATEKWKQAFEGEWPRTGFGIAPLAPYHVNAGGTGWGHSEYWAASLAASNTWQDWMNTTITDQCYIVVAGFFDREATPRVTHIRFRPSGEDLPAINVEEFPTLEEARYFFDRPHWLRYGNPYIVRLKPDDTGIERIGLVGYCIAKRAFLIRED